MSDFTPNHATDTYENPQDRMTRFALSPHAIFYSVLVTLLFACVPLFWLLPMIDTWGLALLCAHFIIIFSAMPLFFYRCYHLASRRHAWAVLFLACGLCALDLVFIFVAALGA
jgi:hypothetical protein